MRTIAETPQHDRYLMVAERISSNAWRSICDSVRAHLAENASAESIKSTLRLIGSDMTPTSFPFVVLFSYADIQANTKWNIAFEPNKQSSIEPTTAVFKFGVFCQRIAQPSLEHGHHQIAVIDFPNGVPALLQSLPIDANRQTYDYIGLCDSEDLQAIQAQRKILSEHSRD